MTERKPHYLVVSLGITMVPAALIAIWNRPFTHDHLGLLLASVIAGGFIWWTSSNLFGGIFISKQGVHAWSEAPLRYWTGTIVVALFTALAIYFLIDRSMAVCFPS